MSSSVVPAKVAPPGLAEQVLPGPQKAGEPTPEPRSAAFRLQEPGGDQQHRLASKPVSSGTLLQPKGCAPGPTRAWPDAAALWGVFALVAGVAGVVLFCFDPRQYHFYPVCFFHATTGLLCPGCGALRAMHQLLHGHLVAAFRFNPMLVVSLPILAWLAARYAWQRGRKEPASLGIRPLWLWLGLGVVLVVSVMRNLPGAPFAMLRP